MFIRSCKSCGKEVKERYKGLCLDCFMEDRKMICSECGEVTAINNLLFGYGTDGEGRFVYYCGRCFERMVVEVVRTDKQ